MRSTPFPGQPAATPAARDTPQGTHAKGPVPGPQTLTPAPTVGGQRAWTACAKGGRPEEDVRRKLAGDTPAEGAGNPPYARTTRARKHGQRAPAPRNRPPRGCAAGKGCPTRGTLLPPLQRAPPSWTRKPCPKPKQANQMGLSPRPRTRAHSTWAEDPGYPLPGRPAERVKAPDPRRLSPRPQGNLLPPPDSRWVADPVCLPQGQAAGRELGASPRTPHAEASGAEPDE